jgi:hypothetical protein
MSWQPTDEGWLEVSDEGTRTYFDAVAPDARVLHDEVDGFYPDAMDEAGVVVQRRGDTMQIFVPVVHGKTLFVRPGPNVRWRFQGFVDYATDPRWRAARLEAGLAP